MTGIQGFDASIQKTVEWLKDLTEEMGWDDRQKAYQALRGTLHALRDRLSVDEAVHFGAQLPMLIRGLYYEGWTIADKPVKLSREEFLERVHTAFGNRAPDPNDMVRAVFRVIRKHVTPGEVADVRNSLPQELQVLWDKPRSTAA